MFHPIKNTRIPLTALMAVVFLSLHLVVACSDSDDPVTPPPTPDPGISGTLGAAGGTLKSGDGAIEFTVSPGALAGDTEITVKPLEGADIPDLGAGMEVVQSFALEPSGLALMAPATLAFSYDNPVVTKERQRKHRLTVAVDVGDFAEVAPPSPGFLEELHLTIDENKETTDAVIGLRGLSAHVSVALVNGLAEGTTGPTLTTYHDWVEAPKMGSDFTSIVGLESTSGWEIRASVQYRDQAMNDLSLGWDDLEELTPDSEGEIPGGYQASYFAELTPLSEGATNLELGFSFKSDIDYSVLYGEEATVPVIQGVTSVDLIMQKAPLTILPEETTEDDWLPNGSYPLRVGLEGMSLMAIYDDEKNKYSPSVLVSGFGGTSINNLTGTNSMANLSTKFMFPDQQAYEGFVVHGGGLKVSPTGLTFVQVGASGLLMSPWDEEINDFGWSQLGFLGQNVTDGQPYDGHSGSGGFVLANNSTNLISLFEFNAETGFFDQVGQISNYPESTGSVVSAAVRSDGSAIIVADGTPGRIYTHDRADVFAPAVYLGDAGDSPRRIRAAGNLAVVSNFASDMITVMTWSNQDVVFLVGMIPVGDGPVGIDLLPLDAGKIAVASTGFNDNTVTVTVLSAVGTLVSNDTYNLPNGSEGPGHVVWLGDPDNRLMVSCNTSGDIVVLDSGL